MQRRDAFRVDPSLAWTLCAAALVLGTWLGLAAPRVAPWFVLIVAVMLGYGLGAGPDRAKPVAAALLLLAAAQVRSARLEPAARLLGAKPQGQLAREGLCTLPPAAQRGTYEPDPNFVDPRRGELRTPLGRLPLALDAQLLGSGETLRIEGVPSVRHPARGPIAPIAGEPLPRARFHADQLVRLGPGPNSIFDHLAGLRRFLSRRLESVPDLEARALALAMVAGDTSLLRGPSSDSFRRTGLSHALSISGMHVSLLHAAVLAPLGFLLARAGSKSRNRQLMLRALWIALAMAVYVPVCGSAPPIRRAAIAIALGMAARALPWRLNPESRDSNARAIFLGRHISPLALLATAAGIECLLDPISATSISAQLSYSATLGLCTLTGPLRALLLDWMPLPRERLSRAGHPLRRFLERAASVAWLRLARVLATTLAASSAAIVGSFPSTWYYFGEWSPAGLVITPLLAPVFLGLILSGWWQALWPSAPATAVLTVCSRICWSTVEWFDALPLTPSPLPHRPGAWIALVGVLLVAGMLCGGIWRARCWRASAFAGGCVLLPWQAAPRGVELVLLDVGHGSAVVGRAPGGDTLVFDCGSRDRYGAAFVAAAPLLAHWEAARTWIVLSHADSDHAGGLLWLSERYPHRRWIGAALPEVPSRLQMERAETAPWPDFGERWAHTDSPAVDDPHWPGSAPAQAGLEVEGGPRPSLDLDYGRLDLGPWGTAHLWLYRAKGPEQGESLNESSRSLELSSHAGRALLLGDAESEGLEELLRAPELEGPFSLVLAPHHGSESTLLGSWLDKLQPAKVWISSAHEAPAARELSRRQIDWSGTWNSGPLHWP